MTVGSHFTPRELAARLARATLGPLDTTRDVEPLRVCDPACGEGALLLEARRLRPRCRLTGMDEDPAALDGAARRLPGADLRLGDALAAEWSGRFDAVLLNPPWASLSGRQAHALPAARRALYARRWASWRGWPSLHGAFLELAAGLLRPGGRLGALLPAQVCELAGYGPTRAALRERCTVTTEPLGEDAFPGIVQPACLLLAVREPGPHGDAPFAARTQPALPGDPASPETFCDIGVHTGNSARRLIGRPGEGWPLRTGREVRAYELLPPRLSLRAGGARAPNETWRAAPFERYAEIPILLRQTASRPVAALHVDPASFRNSVLGCRGVPGVPDALVVAWLNSSAAAAWHAAHTAEAVQRSFPQVKVRHLRALPAPPWREASPALLELAERVARRGERRLATALDLAVSRLYGVRDEEHARLVQSISSISSPGKTSATRSSTTTSALTRSSVAPPPGCGRSSTAVPPS